MSTSLLYHAFGIRGYGYVRTEYEGGSVIFTIKHKSDELACYHCGSHRVIKRGTALRRLRTIPQLASKLFSYLWRLNAFSA